MAHDEDSSCWRFLSHRSSGPRPVPERLVEPEGGREYHRPGYRQHHLLAAVLYAALAQVRDVGAGHDAAHRPVELLARPAAPVQAAVGIEEELEPLGYVQGMFLRISMFV